MYDEACSYSYMSSDDSNIPSEESNVASFLSILDNYNNTGPRPTI